VRLFVRWCVIVAALVVAVLIVPGIDVTGDSAWLAVFVMAAVLGFVNAFIRPLLALLSCGCIVATMGLFLLVVNALSLWLAGYIAEHWFHVGFRVSGFWSAFFGGIVVGIVSFLLNLLLPDEWTKRQRSRRA